jgi:hypothetical protein
MATVGFNMHKYGHRTDNDAQLSGGAALHRLPMRAACTAAHSPRAMLISHHCLLCAKLAVRAHRVQKGPSSSSSSSSSLSFFRCFAVIVPACSLSECQRWTDGVSTGDGVLGAAGCGGCSGSEHSSDPLPLVLISAAECARLPAILAPTETAVWRVANTWLASRTQRRGLI